MNINEIRSIKLKHSNEIENLNKDSTDIFCPNLMDDYYPHRSIELESLNLYDCMTLYDYTKMKPKDATSECYKLNGKNGFLKKRSMPCL